MLSIYYCARRNNNISQEENKKITEIINAYNGNFKYSDIGETFHVFDYNEEESECIFEGMTKLSYTEDTQIQWETMCYWLECLTKI